MIMNSFKEQTLENSRKKLTEASCHVKEIQPYSPWSNQEEVTTKELKLATGMDLRRIKCPKILWDYCLERQAYAHSMIARDIFNLNNETLETLSNSETLDISKFSEYKWYDWVKYRDQ